MTTTSLPELDRVRVLHRAEWPAGEDPPPLPGFIHSSFSPLAAAAADLVLTMHGDGPPAGPELGRDTAIVIVSELGDVATNAAIAHAVDEAHPVPPLLFFQSVPNAVAGHIAKRWQLQGPVYCLAAAGDPEAEGLRQAELLLAAGAARSVLLVVVEPYPATGAARAIGLIVGRDPEAS